MRPRLHAHAATQAGVVTRGQALGAGYTDKEIRVLLRRRSWVRVRHGAYVDAGTWATAGITGQHLLGARAALLAVADDSVASHDTAAIGHDLPTYGLNLSEVRLTRPNRRTARHEAGVAHHVAELPESQIVTVGGLRATALARTALDVARTRGFEAGLVAADAALHAGESADALDQAAALMAEWPGGATSSAVAAAADGRSESVGESLTRLIVQAMGHLVTPQVVIHEAGARVDLLLDEHRVVIEFDGQVKYVDEFGQPDRNVLWKEKKREDRVRDLAYEVVRVTWSGLFGSGRADTERRIQVAIGRAAVRGVAVA